MLQGRRQHGVPAGANVGDGGPDRDLRLDAQPVELPPVGVGAISSTNRRAAAARKGDEQRIPGASVGGFADDRQALGGIQAGQGYSA